jgi:hypothetical protein
MTVYKPVFFTVIVVLLTGCTAIIKDDTKQMAVVEKQYQFSQVQIRVPDKVRKMLHKSFKVDKLRQRIETRLHQDGIWNAESPNTLQVNLTHMYARNTVAAVVLPVSGSDKIFADISVVNNQKAVEQFQVEIRYSLGGTTSGWPFVRMTLLYHNFAMTLSNYFTGKSPHD